MLVTSNDLEINDSENELENIKLKYLFVLYFRFKLNYYPKTILLKGI